MDKMGKRGRKKKRERKNKKKMIHQIEFIAASNIKMCLRAIEIR